MGWHYTHDGASLETTEGTQLGAVVKRGDVFTWRIGARTGFAKTREEAVNAAQRAFAWSQREARAA